MKLSFYAEFSFVLKHLATKETCTLKTEFCTRPPKELDVKETSNGVREIVTDSLQSIGK